MPRKFTRVNAAEKNGQRSTVLYSVAGAVRICGRGPALRCSMSADVGLLCDVPCLRTWRFRRNRLTSEVLG